MGTRALRFRDVTDIHDVLDVEGRPIGEHRASASIRDAVPMKLKQCPYPGTRYQHALPMNVSALKQLTKHWDVSIASLHAFRARHVAHLGHPLTRMVDGLRFGEAIANIPRWLVHRADEPVASGQIPPIVATAFKISLGVNRLLLVMLSGQIMTTGLDSPIHGDTDDLAAFADSGQFVIGAQQVCAGTDGQIKEAIEAMFFGAPKTSGGHDELGNVLGSSERFFAFTESLFRHHSAKFAASCLATVLLNRINQVAQGELHARMTSTIRDLDPAGSMQNFASTRAPAQLNKLITGWYTLAGGAPGSRLFDKARENATEAKLTKLLAGRSQKHAAGVVSTIVRHLATYLEVERTLRPLVERARVTMNDALGRQSTGPTEGADLQQDIGTTFVDMIAGELGVDSQALGAIAFT